MKVVERSVFQYLFLACIFYFLKLAVIHSNSVTSFGVGYFIRYYMPNVAPLATYV